MKFQQRLAMISSAGGCTIVYLLLLYTQGVVQVWHGPPTRHRRSLFADYEFDQNYWNPTLKPIICGQYDTHVDNDVNDTIITVNIPTETNFEHKKLYGMPRPSVNEHDDEKLNVIILPHSHVDAGWLRTVEEYYVINVKKILNNMVKKLNKYENMTFVWAETVFLSMWWNELDDHVKLQVRRLIQKGQLEIALGGWVMSDEASTHYVSVVDQLSEGHQWVVENLHTKPVNSWSIDPFGHSGTMPYLWKQSGMENMVIQRVHQAVKATLAKRKSLEFNWRQFWDKTGSTDILCHIMPYLYYGVQHTCGPDKTICSMYDYGKPNVALNEKSPGKHITESNVAEQAKYLYDQYKLKAGLYKYNTILIPLGDDFRFDNADEWDHNYRNYMKLMDYMNSHRQWNINVRFGTLADYFKQIRQQEAYKAKDDRTNRFPVLKGDFFPYSDQNSDYWTGFYTTRPFAKQLSRNVESDLRAADILHAFVHGYSRQWNIPYDNYHDVATQLQTARRFLGLFLHHDAITGTAKPNVVEDYENKLLHAYQMIQNSIIATTQFLLSRGKLESPLMLSPVLSRTDTTSPIQKYTIPVRNTRTKVLIFNPIAQERTEFIHLIVNDINVEIKNSNGNNIPFQINPIFDSTTKMFSASEYEVVFLAELSPLGIETYFLHQTDERHDRYWTSVTTYSEDPPVMPDNSNFMLSVHSSQDIPDIYLENEFMRLKFNKKGMLDNILDKGSNKITTVGLDFLAYKSDGSGAYLFYPSGEADELLIDEPEIRIIKGPFMEQIQVIYSYLEHTVTIYDTPTVQGQGVHIQNKLNMNARKAILRDTEIIMRMASDVNNKGSFFTDQNGYQLIGRQTDPSRNIETNYYPITTMAVIEDTTKRLTLHSAQSHGAASLKQGWIEVMLDRKVLSDDKKGLGEGVIDNKMTVSNFILQVEYKSSAIPSKNLQFAFPSLTSNIQNEYLQQPVQTLFTTVKSDAFDVSFHPVNHSLPCDVTIVSLKNNVDSDLAYTGTGLTLHKSGFSCDYPVQGMQCSLNDRQVSLKTILPEIDIIDARETTLTNLYAKDSKSPEQDIQLSPMELKTFNFKI